MKKKYTKFTFIVFIIVLFNFKIVDAKEKVATGGDPNPLYNYKTEFFGGSSGETFSDIKQTNDGGFILTGFTGSTDGDITDSNNGDTDGLLLKLDKNFNVQWEQTFGGDGGDVLYQTEELKDGSFVSVGYSDSDKTGEVTDGIYASFDALIAKFDKDGNPMWNETIGAVKVDMFNDVIELDDGNILALGKRQGSSSEITSPEHGAAINGFIVKMDPTNGNVLWDKSIGTYADYKEAVQIKNGNIILVGEGKTGEEITDPGQGGDDGLITIIDTDGNIIDNKLYGSTGDDIFYSVIEDKDGNIVISGNVSKGDGDVTDSTVNEDAIVLKYSSTGNLIFSTYIDNFGIKEELVYDLIQNIDGTYSIVTTEASNSSFAKIITLNNDGSLKYRNVQTDNKNQHIRSIINYEENKFIAVGVGNNSGNDDALILKSDFVPNINSDIEKEIHVKDNKSDDELVNLFNVNAMDKEEGDITNLITVDQSAVDYDNIGEYDVVFTVKDSSNAHSIGYSGDFYNEDTKTVKLKVINDAPIIKADSEQNLSINKILNDDELKKLFNVSASDKEDGDLYSSVVVDSSAVDYTKVGDYTITFSVSDSLGETSSVDVILHISNEKPIIKSEDKKESQIGKQLSNDDLFKLFNVSASDKEDGDLTSLITIDQSSVDYNVPGTYDIILSVTDSDGNLVEKKVKLVIRDLDPTITSEEVKEINLGDYYSDDSLIELFNVSASDTEDGDISSNINVDSSDVNFTKVGEYKIIFSIVDSYGNVVSKEVKLIVKDDSYIKDNNNNNNGNVIKPPKGKKLIQTGNYSSVLNFIINIFIKE